MNTAATNLPPPLSMDSGFRRNDERGQAAASLDVQHADQGEQPPRRVEVQLDLAVEAFLEQLGRLVVDRAAGHVDRLEALGRIGADRFEIAFADREIVAHRPLEAGEAEADRLERAAFLVLDLDGEAIVLDAQQDPERSFLALGPKEIVLEQVEDRDLALLLDLVAAADDRPLVKLDVDDPRRAHCATVSGGA